MELKYTICVPPITKKNSMRMVKNPKTGKMFPLPSKQYELYLSESSYFLRDMPKEPLAEPLNIECRFYMPTRRKVDLTNLLEAVCDILVHYKIIADDNCCIAVSHDGSFVAYDKQSPRTEITITSREGTFDVG